jgi:hypothetical protein
LTLTNFGFGLLVIRVDFFVFQAEADYYREVHVLDLKYQAKYDEINRKRTAVISGQHEPAGAEVRALDSLSPSRRVRTTPNLWLSGFVKGNFLRGIYSGKFFSPTLWL